MCCLYNIICGTCFVISRNQSLNADLTLCVSQYRMYSVCTALGFSSGKLNCLTIIIVLGFQHLCMCLRSLPTSMN